MEKKYKSSIKKLKMFNKKILIKFLIIQFLGILYFNTNKVLGIVPFYKLPTKEFFKKNGSALGRNAYQLIYFGQFKEGLRLAKLAISINPKDENLWVVLAEAQISNKLYDEGLESIKEGKNINPKMGELYFAESSIYLQQKKNKAAKNSLSKGLQFLPENTTAIFQLGNIFLLEKNYEKALENYNEAIKIKSDFWQAINNKGLIYFEINQNLLALENFNKAIKINRNAETLLALAAAIQIKNPQKSILLAKEALQKNPNYVSFKYRKEQLWGENLQQATKILFTKEELQKDIELAKLYKN